MWDMCGLFCNKGVYRDTRVSEWIHRGEIGGRMLRPELERRYKNDTTFFNAANHLAKLSRELDYDWSDLHDLAEVAGYVAFSHRLDGVLNDPYATKVQT